ncbi:ribulose-phosphate 3-epimerase [Gilvimarinus agarilyticus]|uniref:ribulose-phosphate 3-epimerase n=1 Tax=Gilvimarinus sp. 2_MG-2023 TaxID=3062666 RepID=UPI001C08581B|nr:ribulose-phosphate 3-epimerase [Gilvimarinus sp. 2_MG-2023]MBU2887587.1 ribulose-phosphate 3-epimerase [Gilvimarinus agarilyticus]MDO6572238.1 ribulose-phosphate 3-epimerase [Gilvimarinus sp. 2_MG-2023]
MSYRSGEMIVAASVLNADFARLGQECDEVVAAGAGLIHLDVMDNHYVPNMTVGPLVCQALNDYGVSVPIDVHLMVEPVDALIEQFAAAGASFISIHPEATRHLDRSLALIRDLGCRAGLVLNPGTPLAVVEQVLPRLDMLLLMSVNPGFGGQAFIPYVLDKIRAARQIIDGSGLPVRLEVDGGIKVHNIADVAHAGADTFVVGSEIFGASCYKEAVASLSKAIAEGAG